MRRAALDQAVKFVDLEERLVTRGLQPWGLGLGSARSGHSSDGGRTASLDPMQAGGRAATRGLTGHLPEVGIRPVLTQSGHGRRQPDGRR